MNQSSPILRQIACADARTLLQAYDRVADAGWVDGCTVDVPKLLLEVRVTAPWHVRGALEARLEQLERIAMGHDRI